MDKNMNKKVGANYPDLGSFFAAVIIYLLLLSLFIYKIATSEFKNSPSYTDDKNAYMDIYVMDVDDSLVAKSPKFAQKKNDIELKTDKKSKNQEIKTTTKETKKQVKKEEVKKEEVKKEEVKKEEVKKEEVKKEEVKKEEVKKEEVKKEEVKKEVSKISKASVKKEQNSTKKEIKKDTSKDVSLTDLFASSTKNNKNLEESKAQEDAAMNSRKRSAKENKGANSSKSAYQISKAEGEASGRSMKTGIYNEFFGKLEKQLVVLWNTYTPLAGNDATIEITIGANGRLLNYKILQLSYSDEFNQKVRDFEGVLERAQFPTPPNGKPFIHKYRLKDLIN